MLHPDYTSGYIIKHRFYFWGSFFFFEMIFDVLISFSKLLKFHAYFLGYYGYILRQPPPPPLHFATLNLPYYTIHPSFKVDTIAFLIVKIIFSFFLTFFHDQEYTSSFRIFLVIFIFSLFHI